MEFIQSIFDISRPVVPMASAAVLVVLALVLINKLFDRRDASKPQKSLWRHLVILIIALLGLLIIILASPLHDPQKGELLSLLGILLSAAIALSSTTFLGNAMAGIMLRAVRSFKMGDFIRVGDHFGRVTERGIFHIEIQTEYRDLTTLPNLYLVTNPVKVIRTSGTIITAEVSLSYDVSHDQVEKLLIEAAEESGLTDAFVLIMKLGDFSITYRAAGLLTEVKRVISARSSLRKAMLDKLHERGIEIASPTIMTTRRIPLDQSIVPHEKTGADAGEKSPAQAVPETTAFDKADEAESAQKLQQRIEAIDQKIAELKEKHKTTGEPDSESLRKSIAGLQQTKDHIIIILQEKSDKLNETG